MSDSRLPPACRTLETTSPWSTSTAKSLLSSRAITCRFTNQHSASLSRGTRKPAGSHSPPRMSAPSPSPSTPSSPSALPRATTLIAPKIRTAEMVMHGATACLAARISFTNEIGGICERVGADAKLVAEGMGLDKRIGPSFLDAGIAYGGSCFPKGVKAPAALAGRFDYHPQLLHRLIAINRDHRMLVVGQRRRGPRV